MRGRVRFLRRHTAAPAIVSLWPSLFEIIWVDGAEGRRVHETLIIETLLLLVQRVRVPLEGRVERPVEAHALLAELLHLLLEVVIIKEQALA